VIAASEPKPKTVPMAMLQHITRESIESMDDRTLSAIASRYGFQIEEESK